MFISIGNFLGYLFLVKPKEKDPQQPVELESIS
jgi:hypothetical protein